MKNIKITFLILSSIVVYYGSFSFAGNIFIWNLLGTQIEIWLNLRNNSSTAQNWQPLNSLSAQNDIAYRNNYDLVSELDKASSESSRLAIMNQYISNGSNVIANSSARYEQENQLVNKYKDAAKECESKIKERNSAFSTAVKSYDYELAEWIADEIAELRACVAKNEVYAKAHASYASATKDLTKLQNKINYISDNKSQIAKYYEILKPDLLKELYDISQTVNVNF